MKNLCKTEIKEEISRLEIKIKYAKKYSTCKGYPEDSQLRFAEKVEEYEKEIKELNKLMKTAPDTKPEVPPENTYKDEEDEDENDEDEDEPESYNYSEEYTEYREEIDLNDKTRVLETLHVLYPEGLDL